MSHDQYIGKTVILSPGKAPEGQPDRAGIKHRIDSVHHQPDGSVLYDAFIPSSRTEVKLTAAELEDAQVVDAD